MKILHCVSSLLVGGAEKLVKNLAVEQHKQNQQVAVLSFGRQDDEFQKQLIALGVDVLNVRGNVISKQLQLYKLITSFDVIHIHSPAVIRAFLFVAPILMAKRVIYTIHGEVAPDLPLMKLSHKIAQHYVDVTMAVSEKTREKALTLFSWPVDKIAVVKNGISLPKIVKDTAISADKLTIGTVSRLIPLKQIGHLIQCFHDYKQQANFQIKIFGDGPELDSLTEQASQLGVTEHVEFMGNKSNEQDIYPHLDCLIICSETEGLPMVLLEAMAYSIPCISTKVGAIPELLNNSESGLLYDEGNLEQLSAHLDYFANNKAQLAALGHSGRQYVEAEYSIGAVNNAYQRYYRGK